MPHLYRVALRIAKVLTICVVFVCSGEARAQKTDVITLDNGDTITCEIKELQRGKLRCATDAMGDVYVKWEHIAGIHTDKTLEVELETGERYFGSVRAGENPESLTVSTAQTSTTITADQVADVTPINPTFWSRLDGNIDLGATFAQADAQFDFNLNAESTYTGRDDSFDIQLSSLVKRRDDAPTTNKQSLGGSWQRDLRWERWFGIAVTNFERNDDLDLDLRAIGGYGLGRYLALTNRWTWSAYAVGVYSREQYAGTDEGINNIEVGLVTDVQVFTFGDHDTDVSSTFAILPSLTTPGRFRLSLSGSVKREVVKDFYFSVDLTESYDAEPPQAGAEKNDLSFTMSFGWKY